MEPSNSVVECERKRVKVIERVIRGLGCFTEEEEVEVEVEE